MGDLFDLLFWATEILKTGIVENTFLWDLPPEQWDHLIAIGKYIATLMGWN